MNENTALVPLADTMQLGKVLAESGFFQDSRSASQAVVKVIAGGAPEARHPAPRALVARSSPSAST